MVNSLLELQGLLMALKVSLCFQRSLPHRALIITFAEMRSVIRHNIETIGVDNVKLSMSGEEICEIRSAQDCYFTEEETAACVEEAHRLGKRVCSHARARDSVKMSIKYGVDAIYHASFVDDEGMCAISKDISLD
jgi:hypothetical protein